MKFDCTRTCPRFEKADVCRFRPVLNQLGPIRVTSHTARVAVEFRDGDTLRGAVLAMGGTWIGQGCHQLFEGSEIGQGFTLPGWKFPLVAGLDGNLKFDDYKGRWGNVKDIEKLKAAYAVASVEQAAMINGWQCERTAEGGLTVFHPAGGTLNVGKDGSIDAQQFTGTGCHDAMMQLGVPLEGLTAKPEYAQQIASISLVA